MRRSKLPLYAPRAGLLIAAIVLGSLPASAAELSDKLLANLPAVDAPADRRLETRDA